MNTDLRTRESSPVKGQLGMSARLVAKIFMAACSLGKCPRCRTALRNLALRLSTALVV